jgi:hypothetical protein
LRAGKYADDLFRGECGAKEDEMASQQIDLSNLNAQGLEQLFAIKSTPPKETVSEEKKHIVPDEFEIRRRLFFEA